MCRVAVFRDVIHPLGTDLYLYKSIVLVLDSYVERLVSVWLWV